MKIIEHINQPPFTNSPISLTIGNFDGVHLGHQAVIARLVQTTLDDEGESVALTFQNHPSQIVAPESPVKLLCTREHKVALLEKLGLNTLIEIPFTKEFSQQTAEQFLKAFRKIIPFSHLILGYDATLGKGRQGDKEIVSKLGSALGFTVDYVEPSIIAGNPVSSTMIRKFLAEGDLASASQYLGRPYSIMGKVKSGRQVGTTIGFPTANLSLNGLCTPPLGVYAVHVRIRNQIHKGVANIGLAPTIRKDREPLLETFLFDYSTSLANEEIEVFPVAFIRPELHYSSLEVLKEQIAQDVVKAKKILCFS